MSGTWYEATLTVEAGFGSGPYTAPSGVSWTDLTEWWRPTLNTNRGRTSEYSPFAPGTASIVLDNRDRRFDPEHAAGPYFGDLLPMAPIRVTATYDSVTYPVYYGFVQGWPQTIGKGYSDSTVTVKCVDGTRLVSQARLTGSAPAEHTGERIDRVLTGIGWPAAGRAISTGDTYIASLVAEPGSALAYIREIEKVEQGLFFVGRDGSAVFRDRNWQYLRTASAAYGDDPADLQYQDVRPDDNTVDAIRNKAVIGWRDDTT